MQHIPPLLHLNFGHTLLNCTQQVPLSILSLTLGLSIVCNIFLPILSHFCLLFVKKISIIYNPLKFRTLGLHQPSAGQKLEAPCTWASWKFLCVPVHMWLEGCPNPYKMEKGWECTFLKLFTHMNTKWASKKDFIIGLQNYKLACMDNPAHQG